MVRFGNRYFLWILAVVLVCINYLAATFHARLDLTREQRYTLSEPTKKLLQQLDSTVTITVFLQGNLPAGFKRLANSTAELLQEFQEYGRARLQVQFQKIGEGLEGARLESYLDSMARLGLKPYTIKVQSRADDGNEERTVVPGALLTYKGQPRAINLLSGQQTATLDQSVINSTEALLEYKFAQAIQQLTMTRIPAVAYLVGNGETLSENVKSLVNGVLLPNYQFRILPIDSVPFIPGVFDAVMIMKPTQAFSDEQKFKIDQYVVHGGKVIWMIDRLYAEMDSLLRSQSDFVAYDRNLNLDDILFKYGVRINPDLLQDLQCDKFPLVVGNVGDQPQIELVDWPYFPLLDPSAMHPISKNLNKILSIFPNSIDTIITPGIRKTVLLHTASTTRSLQTPAIVSFNSIKSPEDLNAFKRSSVPVAVLLEGSFESLYKNRVSPEKLADAARFYGSPVRSHSAPNKMIVLADADIASNVVTRQEGALEMGVNQFTMVHYANPDFMLNCMEYLVNPTGILETRAKDFTLRLLDARKIEQGKTFWQLVNVSLPVLLILLFGFVFQWVRARAYRTSP